MRLNLLLFIFFFSSRRRHTRWNCDWSSDVCSSDLANVERLGPGADGLRWAKGYTLETVSPRTLEAVRQYLRTQPERHPEEAIPGWAGDTPEYERTGSEQWMG